MLSDGQDSSLLSNIDNLIKEIDALSNTPQEKDIFPKVKGGMSFFMMLVKKL